MLSKKNAHKLAARDPADAIQAALANYPDIYVFARRMVGNADSALDVTQEAFLRLARDGVATKGAEQARRWLFVVARNLCFGRLRRQARRRSAGSEPLETLASPHAGPAESGHAEERRQWVMRAVESLPPHMREVVILREYEGLSYAEIAGVAGCSEGTVKSRLARAREALRERLAPFLEGYR
ncbi:MAG: RNA polymerase sigma factor [Candidatus Hydrogenedentes bacterium]|nr:RNA polymerase sigma factor [Candidatus Hydrogenedentota bacterium]